MEVFLYVRLGYVVRILVELAKYIEQVSLDNENANIVGFILIELK